MGDRLQLGKPFRHVTKRRSTQPGHLSVGKRSEYQQTLGRKQAHRVMYPWTRSVNWSLPEG